MTGSAPPPLPFSLATAMTPAAPLPDSSSRRRAAWLALASPLLVLLAGLALLNRQGGARWEALPALLIGVGLLATSIVIRRSRRRAMLEALRSQRLGRP